MQKTKNYGFKKPEPRDYYNVEDFNNNMDAIDAKLGAIDGTLGNVDKTLNEIDKTFDSVDKKFDDVNEVLNVVIEGDIASTTKTTLQNSCDGRLKIVEIGAYFGEEEYVGNQMFNIASVETGSLTENGVETNDFDTERSNFIYAPDDTYTFSGFKYGERISELIDPFSVPYTVYMFDSNKNYIDSRIIVTGLNSYTLTLVEGTAFVRIVAEKGAFDNSFMMNAGSSAMAWEAFSQKPYIPQDSTAGNQLLDFGNIITANSTVNVNNDTITVSGTAAYSFARFTVNNPTAYIGQNLTLSCETWSRSNANASVTFQVQINDTDGKNTYHDGTTNKTFTVPANVNSIFINIYANNSSSALSTANTTTVKGLMLNKGTTALPYEKYTGGIPAPNPSYPMEIKKSVVKGIRTHWKNCLKNEWENKLPTNENYNNLRVRCKKVISIRKGVAYTLSANDYTNYKYALNASRTIAYPFNINEIHSLGNGADWLNKNTTFTALDDGYLSVVVSRVDDTVLSLEEVAKLKIQFEASPTATPYEPYTETSHTFSQPIELYGRNGVQDVITAKQTEREYKKLIFDGSDDELWIKSTTVEGRYYIAIWDAPKGNVLCTHASQGIKYDENLNKCYVATTQGEHRFSINTSFATLDEWKSHLASKPMEVVYELAKEVVEELPIADQIALNRLQTYDEITYVEFDAELQPTFKAEYGTNKVGGYALEAQAENELSKYFTTYQSDKYKVTMQQGYVGFGHKDESVFAKITAAVTMINEIYQDVLAVAAQAGLIVFNVGGSNQYTINPDNLPLTDNEYTENHLFKGSARVTGDLVANGELRGNAIHFDSIGVSGGAAQKAEWVWNGDIGRWVLCSITE